MKATHRKTDLLNDTCVLSSSKARQLLLIEKNGVISREIRVSQQINTPRFWLQYKPFFQTQRSTQWFSDLCGLTKGSGNDTGSVSKSLYPTNYKMCSPKKNRFLIKSVEKKLLPDSHDDRSESLWIVFGISGMHCNCLEIEDTTKIHSGNDVSAPKDIRTEWPNMNYHGS